LHEVQLQAIESIFRFVQLDLDFDMLCRRCIVYSYRRSTFQISKG